MDYIYWNVNEMNGFSNEQMREIRKGREYGMNTTYYSVPTYSPEKMREIRMCMILGLNCNKYDLTDVSAEIMHSIRKMLEKREDALPILECYKRAEKQKEIFPVRFLKHICGV